MEKITGAFILFLFVSLIFPVEAQQPVLPDSSLYTVKGPRHGVSFFPRVYHPEVEYTPGDTLTFDRYHTYGVMCHWMNRWAEDYPEIVTLYETGRSYEGRPVMQMTITSSKNGSDTDKPGAFFEGNRHSGEITSAESVLWLARHLIEGYGNDPSVTDLLDHFTVYLRPVNNPDGHELYLNTAQSNRSTVRPDDNDGDGLFDEDAPEDLDGDGIILTLRWPDRKNGTLIPDPDDPSGRITKRVPRGEGIYATSSEGIDNDGDGRINEDGIGGLDLHRNYPENWRPEREQTGRGFTQRGAGAYPLSEPETRAVFTFLMTHPNIYVVNSMDTTVPMHLRAPSTSPSEERMYPEDLKWYRYFDDLGRNITGYERAGDVYDDYGYGSPLFGHGPDFGYWYYGAIWYGDELWNGGRHKDYDGDGDKDQIDMLAWDDEENNGEGFHEWKPVSHPVYDSVEAGGFHPKFFSQNPPPAHLEKWASNQALFNKELISHLPRLEWEEYSVKRIKKYRADSADYKLTIRFRNAGKLPTALRQAHLVKMVRPDEVRVKFAADTTGTPRSRVIEPAPPVSGRGSMMMFEEWNRRPDYITATVGYTPGGATAEANFIIRVYGETEIRGTATVVTTRAGILPEKEFIIGSITSQESSRVPSAQARSTD
ncbi:MAG: M14 family metallopeptidase [Bacteroidota bacterium]|nr:M14 family metallopeptidase [Bacteroidota bacterium]